MHYIDQNLLHGERILYRTKKHAIIFITPLILTGLAFYLHSLNNLALETALWWLNLAVILAWCHELLNYAMSDFAVTNKRVMMREGFIFRHANEMRLATVARVDIVQSLLGQILNYGTVSINGFGGGTDVFSLIAFPYAFQKAVQIALDKQDDKQGKEQLT